VDDPERLGRVRVASLRIQLDGDIQGQRGNEDHRYRLHYERSGNIWGQVTSWSIDPDGSIVLNVIGKFIPIPGGHPSVVPFVVKIQQFDGAGVGHWTLAVPDGSGGWFTVCFETLTSGQVVIRWT
jgi:hypothetical protein